MLIPELSGVIIVRAGSDPVKTTMGICASNVIPTIELANEEQISNGRCGSAKKGAPTVIVNNLTASWTHVSKIGIILILLLLSNL